MAVRRDPQAAANATPARAAIHALSRAPRRPQGPQAGQEPEQFRRADRRPQRLDQHRRGQRQGAACHRAGGRSAPAAHQLRQQQHRSGRVGERDDRRGEQRVAEQPQCQRHRRDQRPARAPVVLRQAHAPLRPAARGEQVMPVVGPAAEIGHAEGQGPQRQRQQWSQPDQDGRCVQAGGPWRRGGTEGRGRDGRHRHLLSRGRLRHG